jgi:3-oxoacyl-[acyl-carrier-protein] synthase-1
MAPVMGHRVSPLTDGFLQTGLWIRLGLAALRDLLAYGELPPPDDARFWGATALFVVVPDATSDRFGWPEEDVADIVRDKFATPLAELLGASFRFDRARVFHGHAGGTAAAMAAKALLDGGSFDRAVLLGVDSYVDQLSLRVLDSEGRLKSPLVPVGLMPGEAGACVIFEREAAAARRTARREGSILAAHVFPAPAEPPDADGDRIPFYRDAGRRLAVAAATVLAEAERGAPFAGDVVADLNGEVSRAHAWAAARVGLARHVDFDRSNVVLPCGSFGEIGAASGLVGVCLAVRAFVRGYARGDATLVLSVSEDGEVAAALVGR